LCRAVWKGDRLERICRQQTEILFDDLFYDKDDKLSTSPPPPREGRARPSLIQLEIQLRDLLYYGVVLLIRQDKGEEAKGAQA